MTTLPQILLGFLSFGKIGLLLGFIVGRLSSVLLYVSIYLKLLKTELSQIKQVILSLLEYKKYPLYVSPTLVLDRLSLEAPFFLIPFLFDDEILGFYSIAFRVLSVPLSFFGNALGQVFYKHLTIQTQNREYLAAYSIDFDKNSTKLS